MKIGRKENNIIRRRIEIFTFSGRHVYTKIPSAGLESIREGKKKIAEYYIIFFKQGKRQKSWRCQVSFLIKSK